MKSDAINSEKLLVINQSATKNKINFKIKKKIITFVGKLNRSKGYDLFGKAVIKILKNYKDWSAYVIGDEPRDKLEFNHNRLFKLGFKEHKEVINIYKKTNIAVINWGTYSKQKTVTGNLINIHEEIQKNKIKSPSIVVIGDIIMVI